MAAAAAAVGATLPVAVALTAAVAIAGTLWVPLYARSRPELGPFPFFYWYQLAWVPVTAFLTWIAYRTYSHED